MYKYLLCWRYLRTRYIALASVISVMLGVATMIVVNSVMAGFADKMRDRLHGILADLVVESASMDGFVNYEEVMARVRETGGDDVVAMAPTLETPGILKYRVGSESMTKLVQIIGVQTGRPGQDGRFRRVPLRRAEPARSSLRSRCPRSSGTARRQAPAEGAGGRAQGRVHHCGPGAAQAQAREQVPDQGAIIGYALATWHPGKDQADIYLAHVGSKINLAFPKAGKKPEPGPDEFTVVGYFKSGMSEYDSTHVYVPLEQLQKTRLLLGPDGKGSVNQIQIKVRPGVNLDDAGRSAANGPGTAPSHVFQGLDLGTEAGAAPGCGGDRAEHPQHPALHDHRRGGVRHPGHLLDDRGREDPGYRHHESAGGVDQRNPGIFLGYGLLLGALGSGVGLLGGLLFVRYINEIEKVLSTVLHHKVFDDTIYYFDKIPTLVVPHTVIGIVAGALGIAVLASIWPAQRAARLHPVKALRFE